VGNQEVKRFYVVDALRCVLALCVVFGHVGMFPLFGPVGQPDPFWDTCARAFRTIVWGPPDVIAFFLISGFCIHYPFAQSKRKSPILQFYARRYLRILVPVICTVILFKMISPQTIIFGGDTILWNSTLWSIVCEEIYYAIYPLFNRYAPRVGWSIITKIAFVMSLLASWIFFPGRDWQDMGVIATAVTLFPVWLMGCYLAEKVTVLGSQSSVRLIWFWRIAAWGVMWSAMILHFHVGFYQTKSGLWVGLIYYFWIRAEITYYKTGRPWEFLVWGGLWSYSLYLVHPISIALWQMYSINGTQSRFDWMIVVGFVLAASYVFYLLVERPSHRLARRIPLFSPKIAEHSIPAEII
jgi:peptidoglycan/LPS O-acetylase OafA/YrhL